jgi:EamA domain-containing membrane protein RarD
LNSVIIRAVIVVTFALIFYSVAVITEQKKSAVTKRVLFFLTGGVLLDISSTLLMIIGSTKIPLTVHGCIGYSALTAMLIDAILVWRHWIKNDGNVMPGKIHIYTRIAYGWWVIAYIVGAVMSASLA